MSDELRRRLARAAGDGDLVAAQQLVGILERESGRPATRIAFVCKDAGDARGSMIWATVARDPATSEHLYRLRTRYDTTVPTVVRIRVYEDPRSKASPASPDRSLPHGLASSPSNPSDEAQRGP